MEGSYELQESCTSPPQKVQFLRTWLRYTEASDTYTDSGTESGYSVSAASSLNPYILGPGSGFESTASNTAASPCRCYHSSHHGCAYLACDEADFKRTAKKHKRWKFLNFDFGLKNCSVYQDTQSIATSKAQCDQDMNRNGKSKGMDKPGGRSRSKSVPPANRVKHSRSSQDQSKARKQARDIYKSKDDLHKPTLSSCFRLQCCNNAPAEFYRATSATTGTSDDQHATRCKEGTVSNNNLPSYKDANHEILAQSSGISALPPTTSPPEIPRSNLDLSYSHHMTYCPDHSPMEVMPDLLNSTMQCSAYDQPPYSAARSNSGLLSTSPLHSVNSWGYTQNGSHHLPYGNTPSNNQFSTDAIYNEDTMPQYPPPLPVSPFSQHSLQYPPRMPSEVDRDECDSNAGTVFTFYDIEPGGDGGSFAHPFSPAPSDVHTAISNITRNSFITGSTYFNRHSGSIRGGSGSGYQPNLLSKCVLKFGLKGEPHERRPGYFSCPRKVELLHNGDFVVLDSENQTLQIYSSRGVCKQVYQFKFTIMDMRIWNPQSIALLYNDEIGIFDVTTSSIETVKLEGAHNPRILDTIKDQDTKDKYFIVAMLNEVMIYRHTGELYCFIGNSLASQPGTHKTLFSRINTLSVEARSNDIYVLDGDLRMIYTFTCTGHLKTVLDTSSSDIGPVANPLGMCMNRYGHLIIADTFNHRLIQVCQQSVKCLMQYSVDFYPNDVKLSSDGRLVVAINSEDRTFAGVRVYNYKNAP